MKALLTFAAGGLAVALAAPVAAHDDGAPGKRTEKIVIIERSGDHAQDGEHVRRFRIEGSGPGELAAAHCTGTKDEVDETSADGRQRTRIMVCGNGNLSPAERAEKLEHALARLEARDDLSAEQKAKVTAALRATIERVRAGQ